MTIAGQRPVSRIPHDRDAAKAVGLDGIDTGAEARTDRARHAQGT